MQEGFQTYLKYFLVHLLPHISINFVDKLQEDISH